MAGKQTSSPLVSVVVVTYQPEPGMLRECLDSVAASSYRPLELVVVDNGSDRTQPLGVISEWAESRSADGIRVVFAPQGANIGYSPATNRGVAAGHGELVLLLNPDTVLQPTAIAELVLAAQRHPEAAGFAPKILLKGERLAIDSIGLTIHGHGEAAQRGLGQPDAGQYDLEERVAGLCFAAALIRRPAFSAAEVGPLDERYFMFYEDVDWSMRAQVLGQTFWTVPEAVVEHIHSASTRSLGSGFKSRLIQRNLIWTAFKNFESRRALRVLLRRTAVNLRRVSRGQQPLASLRAVLEAWAQLPELWSSRQLVQARRRRPDQEFLGGVGEVSYFDVETYLPQASVEALLQVLRRLYAVSPEPELERILLRVTMAQQTTLSRDRKRVVAMVREGGWAVRPGLEWLLRELEGRS